MKKILIIEDDDTLRMIVSTFLSSQNYQVIEAENGKEGVELAISSLPNIILSDIMMPVMDGYEALKIIRSNPAIANIPFIFLTSILTNESKELGKNLGANDYITKPFSPKEILSVIESQLKN